MFCFLIIQKYTLLWSITSGVEVLWGKLLSARQSIQLIYNSCASVQEFMIRLHKGMIAL